MKKWIQKIIDFFGPKEDIKLSDRELIILNMLELDGTLEYFTNTSEDELIQFHHSLGQWIRNRWLWKEWKEEDGKKHPDDESYEMIVSLHRKLNG